MITDEDVARLQTELGSRFWVQGAGPPGARMFSVQLWPPPPLSEPFPPGRIHFAPTRAEILLWTAGR